MKKTTFIFAACLLHLVNSSAQNFQSVYKFGGSGFDYAEDFTRDNNGNVIAVGSFQYSADFDPGAGSVVLTEAGNTGNSDGYIASYTSAGTLNWAVNLGSNLNESIAAVDVDTLGNIYAAGYFSSSFDCNPGSGTTTITSAGAYDWFIVKFNSAGVFQWGTSWGNGGLQNDFPKTMRVKNGQVYIGGNSQNASYLSQPTFAVFAANNGSLSVLGVCNVTDNGEIDDMEIDPAGYLYITGKFRGTTDFDINLPVSNAVSQGADDAFVAKYSPYPNLNLDWVKSFGGPFTDMAYGVDVDQYRVYLTGSYQGTIDADPNAGVTNLTATGSANGFVVRLDQTGNLIWANSILPGSGPDYCNPVAGVKLDVWGAIYVGGNYSGSLDLDMNAGTHIITAAGNDNDAFWVKYDLSGNFLEGHTIEGSNTYQSINEMIPVSASEFYAYGEFDGNFTNFDPGNTNTMLNASGRDIFVSYYASCAPSASSITASICNGSNYTFGSQILTSSGTYYDTLTAASGCDSIVTLTLTVNTVNTNISNSNGGYTLNALGSGTYQWIDCVTGQPLAGQTAASFTPAADGQYAVVVTDNGCSDTSTCVTVIGVGMPEHAAGTISIYPNPMNELLCAELSSGEITLLEIYDLSGVLVKSVAGKASRVVISTTELSSGMYIVRVQTGTETITKKITRL